MDTMNQKPVNNTFMFDCWPKDCVSGGHMASDPMYHTPSVQCPAVQVLKRHTCTRYSVPTINCNKTHRELGHAS